MQSVIDLVLGQAYHKNGHPFVKSGSTYTAYTYYNCNELFKYTYEQMSFIVFFG